MMRFFGISLGELAVDLTLGSGIAFVLSLAAGPHTFLFVPLLAVSVAVVSAIRLFVLRARRMYESSVYKRHLFDAMERLSYYAQMGVPLPKAAELVSAGENGPVARRMRVAKRELLFGRDIASVLEGLGISGAKSDLASSLEAHKARIESHAAELEGTVQTYATLNMFISTIAPAFIVFALIGSTVVAGSLNGLFAVSLALLFAVPLAYAFANTLMYRRMYAQ
ncbi:MAG: hypothetical protein QXT43_02270 [Candidatus Micrarchaeaceae archaeon]